MNKLWNAINKLRIKKNMKNKLFLSVLIIINLIFGFLLWMALGRFVLLGIDWLVCFLGYPAYFIGYFGGTIYLYNHEF